MMKKLVKTFGAIVKIRLKKITKSNLILINQVAKIILKILTTKRCNITLYFSKLDETTS